MAAHQTPSTATDSVIHLAIGRARALRLQPEFARSGIIGHWLPVIQLSQGVRQANPSPAMEVPELQLHAATI